MPRAVARQISYQRFFLISNPEISKAHLYSYFFLLRRIKLCVPPIHLAERFFILKVLNKSECIENFFVSYAIFCKNNTQDYLPELFI